jgi:guanyl-specific ribonuclease Sa
MSGPRGRRTSIWVLVAVIVAVVGGLALSGGFGNAPKSSSPGRSAGSGQGACALSGLPPQVADTVEEIQTGGPFRYRQDGVTFDNRERLLPREALGYYHEYTVTTPGSADRGTRRVITGGSPSAPVVLYYTGDHYASFCRLVGAG